ncbi:MAG TPA: twin-arginine translocase TatA/TatE family subunit [Candidatus Dormibacteraeota bacterium]|nr:twin-arginine translocase TatA/TatE family subunit [Candidatus Dormibacteraeota bacterium]
MPFLGNHFIWVILLVIVLIIFGPGKLPQIGSAVGSALKEFRKATNELKDEVARTTAPAEGGQPEPNKEATGAPKA